MPWIRCKETLLLFHLKLSGRWRKNEHCVGCGLWAHADSDGHLCDFIVGARSKTCDAPICWECTEAGAIRRFINKEGHQDTFTFCPRHFNHYIETGKEKHDEKKDR